MRVIVTKHFPPASYGVFNFFELLFVKEPVPEGEDLQVMLNHEGIHTAQMREMLWIFFYLWYGLEYLIIRLLRLRDPQTHAYRDVSFEEEAYAHEADMSYLTKRKYYAWVKYLKIWSYGKDN